MDDCSGSFILVALQRICVDLSKIFGSVGFQLKTWLSNVPDVLNAVESDNRHPNLFSFNLSAKLWGCCGQICVIVLCF